MAKLSRAVFLDRDGVVNQVKLVQGLPKPPSDIKEIEILDGVSEAIEILLSAKFIPVIITNQPDVSRGTISHRAADQINKKIQKLTGIKFAYTCFHDDIDRCLCRKPLPGLIYQAAFDLHLDVHQSYLVGDRWRDIQAGQVAGCQNFFLDYSYPELQPKEPFTRVYSLLQAVRLILGGMNDV